MPIIDDELKAEAARLLAKHARRRMQEFADSPAGKTIGSMLAEQRRIMETEGRRANQRDLARYILRIMAGEADDDGNGRSEP